MTAKVTTTTKTGPILGGPDPWSRDPIHNASSGLPVHTFSATTSMVTRSPTRFARSMAP
jgi:hypothetical protein